jgi:hypothetical protein
MPTGTTTTTITRTATTTARNKEHVSEPGLIHNKGTATRERDVLVIYSAT